MKFNKIISALMGGAFLFGMAACTDEVEYTPADVIPGNNVYFPVDESTTVEKPLPSVSKVRLLTSRAILRPTSSPCPLRLLSLQA